MSYDSKRFVCQLPEAQPLPPFLQFSEPGIEIRPDHHDAYSLAIELAGFPAWPDTPLDTDKFWPLGLVPSLASRILGYLLIEAPVQDAADRVAKEINACCKGLPGLESADALYLLADLARFYALSLFKPCTGTHF